jgi:polysaccharide deacetylase family protein (PEP-CTERM system associated)
MAAARAERTVLNGLSVDVEDYFHVSGFEDVVARSQWDGFDSRVSANTERLLEIFDEYRVRATFFVLGWVADRFPLLIRRIAGFGHEIASHGYAHHLVYRQTCEAFREDVKRAKAVLESQAQAPVLGYRAPSYSITRDSLWALDVLIDEGFTYDSSVFPIYHDRYGIPDAPRHPFLIARTGGSIVELPASTLRLGSFNLPVSGGGYFRIAPYAWTRWAIGRINSREKLAAIFYLHPWEIDPGQPKLPASFLARVRHYRNLDKTEPRLRDLLRRFKFGPLRAVLEDARPLLDRSWDFDTGWLVEAGTKRRKAYHGIARSTAQLRE